MGALTDSTLERGAQDAAFIHGRLRCLGEFFEIPNASRDGGIIPFGWASWLPEQRRFEVERTGHDIVLKSRQMGFSTIELARDLQYARTHDAVQVLVVVHDAGEKKKLFSRLRMMAERAYAWGLLPAPKTDTQTSITWADNHSGVFVVEAGSSTKAAEKKGRSGTVHRLHATETAFWGAARDTWTALEGAMEHGSEAVVESTANGQHGIGEFFFKLVQDARAGQLPPYRFHFFPWFERVGREAPWSSAAELEPRTEAEHEIEEKLIGLGCTPEQLAWWRIRVRRMTLAKALQEYPPTPDDAFQIEGEVWLDPAHVAWLKGHVDDGFEEHELKIRGKDYDPLRVFERPKPKTLYLVSIDPAEGEGGGDEAALSVMEYRSMRTVAAWHSRTVKAGDLGHVAAYVGRYFNNAFLAIEIEAKGGGRETVSVVRSTERYPTARVFKRRIEGGKRRFGWSTNGQTRPVMFGDLAKMIEDHDIWTPDAKMVSEAATLVPTNRGPRARDKGKKGGADDGLFVTWAMNVQVRAQINVRPAGVRGVGRRRAHRLDT